MIDLPNFDPIKVGDEIAALESEAQDKLAEAKGEFGSRSEKIAAILWQVKQYHPEHLDAICARAKIGRSRRYELLRIGSGRKTAKQARQETAARQTKSRATKKARAATESVTVTDSASEQPKGGNNTDNAKSATKMAAAHTANESDVAPATKPKPGPSKSSKALAQFKVACDRWLPLLNERDQDQASTHVNSMFEKLKNSRSSPGEAA
jgi:pyruvate/2-oxoglutarate dehydrogenase complex dihydrolipoamide acyltransferase (E2) component